MPRQRGVVRRLSVREPAPIERADVARAPYTWFILVPCGARHGAPSKRLPSQLRPMVVAFMVDGPPRQGVAASSDTEEWALDAAPGTSAARPASMEAHVT